MRHDKVLIISLVSAFVFSAVGASAASALQNPEFETAKFPVEFAGSGGANKLETVGGNTVSCKGDSFSGTLQAAREVSGRATFTGCTTKVGIFTEECRTKGAAAGEIVTDALKVKPVYINGGTEAGIDLMPESGTEFAKFECGTPPSAGDVITVTGTEVCKVPPKNAKGEPQYNVKVKELEVVCAQTKGKQNPEEYEEPPGTKHKDILKCKGEGSKPFGPEQCAWEFSFMLATTSEVVLRA